MIFIKIYVIIYTIVNMKGEEWLEGHSSFIVKECVSKMKKSVKDTVRELIEPTVNGLGYLIWDVLYSKVGADYHLEITIDKEGGIDIDDCEKVHRAIDPIIDEADPIEDFYYLEVSSPGIERELRTDEHISLSVGQKVEAKLFAERDGRKSVRGYLKAFDGGVITITEDDAQFQIDKKEIAKLTTVSFE